MEEKNNHQDNVIAMHDFIYRLKNINKVGFKTEIFRTSVNIYKNRKLIYNDLQINLNFYETNKFSYVQFFWDEKISNYKKIELNGHYSSKDCFMYFDNKLNFLEIKDNNIKIIVNLPSILEFK